MKLQFYVYLLYYVVISACQDPITPLIYRDSDHLDRLCDVVIVDDRVARFEVDYRAIFDNTSYEINYFNTATGNKVTCDIFRSTQTSNGRKVARITHFSPHITISMDQPFEPQHIGRVWPIGVWGTSRSLAEDGTLYDWTMRVNMLPYNQSVLMGRDLCTGYLEYQTGIQPFSVTDEFF